MVQVVIFSAFTLILRDPPTSGILLLGTSSRNWLGYWCTVRVC